MRLIGLWLMVLAYDAKAELMIKHTVAYLPTYLGRYLISRTREQRWTI